MNNKLYNDFFVQSVRVDRHVVFLNVLERGAVRGKVFGDCHDSLLHVDCPQIEYILVFPY